MSMIDQNLSSQIEIYFGARNLKRMDYFSKSDPKLFVYLKDFRSPHVTLIGQTETVRNSHNPDFDTSFIIEYYFEENQQLIVRAFDTDDDKQMYKVGAKNYIGEATFTIGDIVGSSENEIEAPIKDVRGEEVSLHQVKNFTGVQVSTIITRCEEVSGANQLVSLQVTGRDLDVRYGSCLSWPSPYLEIFKKREVGSEVNQWQKIYTSETIHRTLNPRFKTFQVRLHSLCHGDYDRPIMFKVWHNRKFKGPLLVGQGKTTFKEIFSFVKNHEEARKKLDKSTKRLNLRGQMLPLIHPDMKAAKGARYKNSGVLLFHKADLLEENSFLDFIQGGLNLRMMVAIDFTASNGNQNDPSSLHYIDPTRKTKNKYEMAIEAIGKIVAPYDSDQMFPVWGFGAVLLESGKVSHHFPLTFSSITDEVNGVEGILKAYRNAFLEIEMSGPTIFSPVIKAATEVASAPFSQYTQHYSILLIITDGIVNDMKATIRGIIKASSKPLSIIIIGVGDADFSDMDVLDGDIITLRSGRKEAERDIVQFVSMKQFRQSDITRISSEVLSEIPHQLLSFMRSKGAKPMIRRFPKRNAMSTPGPDPVSRKTRLPGQAGKYQSDSDFD